MNKKWSMKQSFLLFSNYYKNKTKRITMKITHTQMPRIVDFIFSHLIFSRFHQKLVLNLNRINVTLLSSDNQFYLKPNFTRNNFLIYLYVNLKKIYIYSYNYSQT